MARRTPMLLEYKRRSSSSFVPSTLIHPHLSLIIAIEQKPHEILPKLFGPLRERYLNRPGGYTRVLRIEPEKEDQAPSAILELVDGPKDIRFAMTAKTIANVREKGNAINDMTAANIQKVIRYRPDGERDLEDMVAKFETLAAEGDVGVEEVRKKRVYPRLPVSR
jgi:large subunit ribosomal protein L17